MREGSVEGKSNVAYVMKMVVPNCGSIIPGYGLALGLVSIRSYGLSHDLSQGEIQHFRTENTRSDHWFILGTNYYYKLAVVAVDNSRLYFHESRPYQTRLHEHNYTESGRIMKLTIHDFVQFFYEIWWLL